MQTVDDGRMAALERRMAALEAAQLEGIMRRVFGGLLSATGLAPLNTHRRSSTRRRRLTGKMGHHRRMR